MTAALLRAGLSSEREPQNALQLPAQCPPARLPVCFSLACRLSSCAATHVALPPGSFCSPSALGGLSTGLGACGRAVGGQRCPLWLEVLQVPLEGVPEHDVGAKEEGPSLPGEGSITVLTAGPSEVLPHASYITVASSLAHLCQGEEILRKIQGRGSGPASTLGRGRSSQPASHLEALRPLRRCALVVMIPWF